MLNLENAKWNFSNEEKYAIKWLEEKGFDVKLEKQFVSKTVFTVEKEGVKDKFELVQGLKSMNIRTYMEQFQKSWDMYVKLQTV